jgi:hypothetical protein
VPSIEVRKKFELSRHDPLYLAVFLARFFFSKGLIFWYALTMNKLKRGDDMKRLLTAHILVLYFIFGLLVSDAAAIGFGFDLSAGFGNTDWEEEDWGGAPKSRYFSSDDSTATFAYFLDTNVAKNRLFNYRLSFGWEKSKFQMDAINDTLEADGLFMSHDFGFGFFRSKDLRVWTGPELRFSRLKGEFHRNKDVRADVNVVAFGPVVGANFRAGEKLFFAVKGGLLVTDISGEGRSLATNDLDYEADGTHSFFSIAVIFRSGDKY